MNNSLTCKPGVTGCGGGVLKNGKPAQFISVGTGASKCQVVAICGGNCKMINGQAYCV